MSRLLVLGMLPLAALSASEGAKGANTLSAATMKAEHGASTKGLLPSWNKHEHKNGDQRRRGLGSWSGPNTQNMDTGLLETRQLQTTGGGCGDGIAGIRSSDGDGFICCMEECGVCGGVGCSTAGGDGFDSSHCCVSTIAASGRTCAETGEAPCIMEEATGCGNGIAGVRSEDGTGDVCCLEECGVCGGSGCGSAAGPGFDTSHCCVSVILAAGATCSETGAAPCVIDDDAVPGDKDGDGGIDGFAFRGCYLAEGSDPFSEITEDAAMTPELCFDTCALKSSLYMGLLKGNECGCGEDPSFLASDKADGVCDEPCPGDNVQTCGGALAYDLFELMDDVADDPIDEGTSDGTSDSDSSNPNELTGYLYTGCFEESSFDPFTLVTPISGMTIRLCAENCGVIGAEYAGLMDGNVCGCGSEPGFLDSPKEDGTCFTECAGDEGRLEYCGGETSYDLLTLLYAASATNIVAVNATPSPAPELTAQLNSDAAGDVVAAPTGTSVSSDASVLTSYTHLGCFAFEVEADPFFSLVQMDGMTYHMCSEACGELDAVYMGVLDGNLCGCGNEEGYLLSLKPEGTCDVECSGSVGDTDTCGGSESFDLFLINYLANDDDYFGPDSVPIQAGVSSSGGLEEGAPYSDDDSTDDVDSTTDFETGQVATVVAPMTGFQYVGCYEMEADHDPFSTLDQMNNMTLSTCAEFCGAQGAVYSAVMNGDMCGCGSEEGYLASEKEEGLCLVECAGNDERIEFCGGTSSFDLFEIIYMVDDGTGESGGSDPAPSPSSGLTADSASESTPGVVADEMTGYIYNGCYQIEADFDPFTTLSQINAMTPTACNEMCGAMGALYAGVMDGDLCGCGSVNNYLEVDKDIGECLTECTGDDGRTEMCGGSASFGLFEIFYRESVVGGGR